MKKIQNGAAFLFIICVVVLAIISILGVWKIFSDDVVGKSMQTFGLLAIVAVIVIFSGKFIDSRGQPVSAGGVPAGPEAMPALDINPAFTSIRHGTIAILIVSVSLLALMGVLAIWDVLSGEVLHKSLSSISIVAFSSLIIVVTCMEREQHRLMKQKMSKGLIVLLVILGWTLLHLFLGFL